MGVLAMSRLISDKYTAAAQYQRDLRNIRGTFAAEGMTISESTCNSMITKETHYALYR